MLDGMKTTDQGAEASEAAVLDRLRSLVADGYDEVGFVALLGKDWRERRGERRALLSLRLRGEVDSPEPGFFALPDRRRRGA